MGYNPDYWDEEQSEADLIFAELREKVYESVSDDITNKIKALSEGNKRLEERVKNLDNLERDAYQLKREYEVRLEHLERSTKGELRRMEAAKILSFITEEKFGIIREYERKPKCDKCDESRHIKYTTPRGRPASEACECAKSIGTYVPVPMNVKSFEGRGDNISVWWEPTVSIGRYDREDWDMRTRRLKVEGTDEDKADDPTNCGFDTIEEAQRICDLANAPKEKEEGETSWV